MSKPVAKFKEGGLSFSIWENNGTKGAFRTASLQFQYRDKKDGTWKDSNLYSVSDLETLEKLAKQAREHLTKFKNEQKGDNSPQAA
jgi:hypothetical protein